MCGGVRKRMKGLSCWTIMPPSYGHEERIKYTLAYDYYECRRSTRASRYVERLMIGCSGGFYGHGPLISLCQTLQFPRFFWLAARYDIVTSLQVIRKAVQPQYCQSTRNTSKRHQVIRNSIIKLVCLISSDNNIMYKMNNNEYNFFWIESHYSDSSCDILYTCKEMIPIDW